MPLFVSATVLQEINEKFTHQIKIIVDDLVCKFILELFLIFSFSVRFLCQIFVFFNLFDEHHERLPTISTSDPLDCGLILQIKIIS